MANHDDGVDYDAQMVMMDEMMTTTLDVCDVNVYSSVDMFRGRPAEESLKIQVISVSIVSTPIENPGDQGSGMKTTIILVVTSDPLICLYIK